MRSTPVRLGTRDCVRTGRGRDSNRWPDPRLPRCLARRLAASHTVPGGNHVRVCWPRSRPRNSLQASGTCSPVLLRTSHHSCIYSSNKDALAIVVVDVEHCGLLMLHFVVAAWGTSTRATRTSNNGGLQLRCITIVHLKKRKASCIMLGMVL